MSPVEELFAIAERLDSSAIIPDELVGPIKVLQSAAKNVGRSHSGSWLGYHANVYYLDLAAPEPGDHFSQEWGLMNVSIGRTGPGWHEYPSEHVKERIAEMAGYPDVDAIRNAAKRARTVFEDCRPEVESILSDQIDGRSHDTYIRKLLDDLGNLKVAGVHEVIEYMAPKGKVMTRDMTAMGQGTRVPPHAEMRATAIAATRSFKLCEEAGNISRKAASHLERTQNRAPAGAQGGTNVFIGVS